MRISKNYIKQTELNVFSKGNERIVFDSEKEACEAMGVRQCSVASCYRRGSKCKGYAIARMDKEN